MWPILAPSSVAVSDAGVPMAPVSFVLELSQTVRRQFPSSDELCICGVLPQVSFPSSHGILSCLTKNITEHDSVFV